MNPGRRWEPWPLFCDDDAFAEAWLRNAILHSNDPAEQASLVQLLSRLGAWSAVAELLEERPQLLEQADARAALLHLRQTQGHPNPWLALLPAGDQQPFLEHWRRVWAGSQRIQVMLSGGLGDQLEAVGLCSSADQLRQRLALVVPEASSQALKPLLELGENHRLPRWRFGQVDSSQPWLSLMAMRAVLADAGVSLVAEPTMTHLRDHKPQAQIVVCWRSKVDPGERLWAHLRSLPIRGIEQVYRWLIPWAATRNWRVVDVTPYQPGELVRMASRVEEAVLDLAHHRLTSLRDTASLVAASQLVVSVDTALIHVAHALDVPRWLLLHRQPDPRWQQRLQQDGSCDRENLRVLQQTTQGRWLEPLSQLRAVINGLGA